jgi:branched-subunit amino acid ABC-type transport system permease component
MVNGVVSGAAIGLAAVGLTLSYGVSQFINFAYGEYLTYGAFLTVALGGLGLGIPIAAVLAVLLVGALTAGLAALFFRPLRSEGQIPLLITSFGVAFVMRTALRGYAGTGGRTFGLPLMRPIQLWEIYLPVVDAVVLVVTLVVMLCVYALLYHTLLGKRMRALSGNRTLARIEGIDVDRTTNYSWFVSGTVGALAGVLLALRIQPFKPTLGWEFLLVVFAATILGGIGRPLGAVLGSLIIGLTMSLGSTYLSSSYTVGYAFIVLIVTLLLRPQGILEGEF